MRGDYAVNRISAWGLYRLLHPRNHLASLLRLRLLPNAQLRRERAYRRFNQRALITRRSHRQELRNKPSRIDKPTSRRGCAESCSRDVAKPCAFRRKKCESEKRAGERQKGARLRQPRSRAPGRGSLRLPHHHLRPRLARSGPSFPSAGSRKPRTASRRWLIRVQPPNQRRVVELAHDGSAGDAGQRHGRI